MDALLAAGVDPALTARGLGVALLLWARLLPLVFVTPWLRFPQAPAAVWLGSSLVLTLCLWPTAMAGAPPLPPSLLSLLPLLLRELAVGAVYGVCFALPLLSIAWGGELLDRLRGAASDGEASTLGQLYGWLAVAVFFAAGGHRLAIESLAGSVARVPVGAVDSFEGPLSLALGSARLVGDALSTALSLLLPVALTLLVVELCVSLALRASATLSGLTSMAGARSLLALAVVLLGLPPLLQLMPGALEQGVRAASQLLRAL